MSAYAFAHAGHVYTPDGQAAATLDVAGHNAALEAAELARWATAPATFVAYVVNGHTANHELQTWTGKFLGYVSSYRIHRNNLGARIASVRVRGSNGAEYYGRMSAEFDVIRLRKAKG